MIEARKDCNVILVVNSFRLPLTTKEKLKELSFFIEEYNNPEEAMHVFMKEPRKYEIALIDSGISEVSSIDLANKMKLFNQELRIAMIVNLDTNIDSDDKDDYINNVGEASNKNIIQIQQDNTNEFIHMPIQNQEFERLLLRLSPQTYHKKIAILQEIETIGIIDVSVFEGCTLNQLEAILKGFNSFLFQSKKRNADSTIRSISDIDRKMLDIFLSTNGRVSSLLISRTIGTPLTTVQRRRKKLERDFLETSYHLRFEKFNLRRAQVLISVDKDSTPDIAKELLSFNEIIEIGRSIGMDNVDLHADVIFTDNSELLELIERIRAIKGVKATKWVEIVKNIGKNPMPARMLDAIVTKKKNNINNNKNILNPTVQ